MAKWEVARCGASLRAGHLRGEADDSVNARAPALSISRRFCRCPHSDPPAARLEDHGQGGSEAEAGGAEEACDPGGHGELHEQLECPPTP